jgi:hypothetical protein
MLLLPPIAEAATNGRYSLDVKQIWTGRAAQAAAKYGENAPMAAVCCNACRTCFTSNILSLLTAAAVGAIAAVRRITRPA